METTNPRVSKREFISRVATRSELSVRVVNKVYESLLGELTGAVSCGEAVVLTSFGRFYRQDHKGHKVRFGKSNVDDYVVLKFSASSSFNRRLGGEVSRSTRAVTKAGCCHQDFRTGRAGLEAVPEPVILDVL
ncbi:HU family DNA-binding protein [Streptomyces sp. NBC_01456]|uniref:HU family DNA-binding protein n=1 Tax=unclassified Streptomyces TaxID=2593676 RepID=UPI002E321F0D|nr:MULTISPECIES: HU family DNA-binding protein [unclassified Streptomyces]